MKMRRIIILPVLCGLFLFGGCSDEGSDPANPGDGGPDPVSFAAQVQPVFDGHCAGCHGAGGNAGLDLRQGVSHGNLVGVPAQASSGQLVVAGDAAGSILYRRMTGDGLGVMPPDGSLDATTIDLVRRWIDEGAADN